MEVIIAVLAICTVLTWLVATARGLVTETHPDWWWVFIGAVFGIFGLVYALVRAKPAGEAK